MTLSPSRSYDLLWLSLAVVPLVLLSYLFSIHAQDYWWYLRVGQETLESGSVPAIDTISWTQAGRPVVYQPWLAGVFFWLAHDLGGAPLTYLLRGFLLAITFCILWVLARQASSPRLATILLLIMGLSSTNNWQMRTQLFAYPLFALCLYALYQWQNGRDRSLWLLPVCTVLWSNLHGSFVLAPVLAGAALVFGQGNRKPLLIAVGLMALGTLANPRGLDTWRYLDFMLRSPSDQLYSVEWFPPTNEGWQMNIFFAWILLLAPVASLSSRRPAMLEWVWFLGFGWLAFSGIRYVVWCLFILCVMTAGPLAGLRRGAPVSTPVKSTVPAFNIGIAGIFLLLSLLYLPGIRERWWSDAPPAYSPESNPAEAVEWLKAHPGIHGPMWNDFAFGSYLAFFLPARPTWLDSRFFVFPPEQMENYQKIGHATPEWEDLVEREGVNLLFLSTASQSRLIASAGSSPDWCEQYRDEYAVIFSRCEPIR